MTNHPNAAVIVSGGGSTRGYKSLLDGTADVAVVSGPMSSEMRTQFDRRGVRVRVTTVGHKPVVAVVNPANPLRDVSVAELGAIFSGRIDTWRLAGQAQPVPIRVLVGSPTGGLTEAWRMHVLPERATFPATARVMTLEQRVAAVTASPSAITYLALGEVPRTLRFLTINGVAPTPANVSKGTYPFASALQLVTLEKTAPVINNFIEYFFTPNPPWDLDGLQVVRPR